MIRVVTPVLVACLVGTLLHVTPEYAGINYTLGELFAQPVSEREVCVGQIYSRAFGRRGKHMMYRRIAAVYDSTVLVGSCCNAECLGKHELGTMYVKSLASFEDEAWGWQLVSGECKRRLE